MGKRDLSEEDIKAQYITPAIESAGWDIKKQVRLEYPFTAGRIILRGNVTSRGQKKRVDYANTLDIKYVYASHGDEFVEQNLLTGEVRNVPLDAFPSSDELNTFSC